MKHTSRKIIFECHVGSRLYGTNRPDSDIDTMGVFLPSSEDLFTLTPGPDEIDLGEKVSTGTRNTSEDKDRKIYRLDKFLRLLAEGQSKQVEMLFAPKELWISSSPEWEEIVLQKDLFLSKLALIPFSRFAKAQSQKAVMKGENLNNLRELLEILKTKAPHRTLESQLNMPLLENKGLFKILMLQENVPGFEIAGKKYLFKEKVKDSIRKMEKLIYAYGPRSHQASESGYDYKSLSHAYRLLFLAEELMTTGKLTLPMEKEQTEFLKSIRNGTYQANYWDELEEMRQKIESLPCSLPETADMEKINLLCIKMIQGHFA